MTARCPAGHDSTEHDYCSVCGAGMGTAAAGEPCPTCQTPRAEDARFCEVCRYDFEARQAGPAPVATEPVTGTWAVTVVVDPSLDTEPDPDLPAPTDVAERSIPIDAGELLIGRHDDRRDIHPDIPVLDPAVSRRHAKVIRLPDGQLAVQDLASSNGTEVNAQAIQVGVPYPLHDGDAVTIGRWTRITVHHVL